MARRGQRLTFATPLQVEVDEERQDLVEINDRLQREMTIKDKKIEDLERQLAEARSQSAPLLQEEEDLHEEEEEMNSQGRSRAHSTLIQPQPR